MQLRATPELRQLQLSIRFVQGYRYLDKAGEAIARLESTLAEGWIPGEIVPTAGVMKNYVRGLTAKFNSEALTVDQTEYIDFEIFKDQACKIYDVLWRLFEVESVIAPLFRVIFQVGSSNLDHAEAYIQALGYVIPSPQTLKILGGKQSALAYTIVTEADTTQYGMKSKVRRRLAVNSVSTTAQADMDSRILQRVSLLTTKHKEAVRGLLELRRRHVSAVVNAVLIDFEQDLEGEYNTNSLPLGAFLDERWAAANAMFDRLPRTFEKED